MYFILDYHRIYAIFPTQRDIGFDVVADLVFLNNSARAFSDKYPLA
jgi:hypothetical protein